MIGFNMHSWKVRGGTPQNSRTWNYPQEGRLLVVQTSSTGWVFSVPAGNVVRGCIWLQWIFFFLKTLNVFAHFMMGDLSVHLPTPHWVFSSFWLKNGMTPVPYVPYSPDLALSDFFLFPRMKKVLKGGKRFANVEEVKQKTAEALTRHQNQWIQKLFWAGGKCLDTKCIASNGVCFEGNWSLNM